MLIDLFPARCTGFDVRKRSPVRSFTQYLPSHFGQSCLIRTWVRRELLEPMQWSRHELIVCVASEQSRETLEAIAFRQRLVRLYEDVENRGFPHAMPCVGKATPSAQPAEVDTSDPPGSDALTRLAELEFGSDDRFRV